MKLDIEQQLKKHIKYISKMDQHFIIGQTDYSKMAKDILSGIIIPNKKVKGITPLISEITKLHSNIPAAGGQPSPLQAPSVAQKQSQVKQDNPGFISNMFTNIFTGSLRSTPSLRAFAQRFDGYDSDSD